MSKTLAQQFADLDIAWYNLKVELFKAFQTDLRILRGIWGLVRCLFGWHTWSKTAESYLALASNPEEHNALLAGGKKDLYINRCEMCGFKRELTRKEMRDLGFNNG